MDPVPAMQETSPSAVILPTTTSANGCSMSRDTAFVSLSTSNVAAAGLIAEVSLIPIGE